MRHATLGQLLIESALPEDLHDGAVLDKKGVAALMQRIATQHPDEYAQIAKRLSDVGHHAATSTGGHSFGLRHLRATVAGKRMRFELGRELDQIHNNRELSDDARDAEVLKAVSRHQKTLPDDVLKEAMAHDNPIARQLIGAGRGNKMQLSSLLGADLLYTDHRGNPVPIPVLRNYSQGLSPVEYFAGSFGARKGVFDTKMATQNAGFFCLDEETEVRMADGSVALLKDIQAGDLVLGVDVTGRTFPVRVNAVSVNGLRDVYRYRFRVGKSRNGYTTVAATVDHKVLAKIKRGRNPAWSVLNPTQLPLGRCGTGFRLVLPTGFNDVGLTSEPRAGILGLLLAEGGLTGNNTNFSTADPLILAAAEAELSPLGFRVSKRNGKDYEYTIHDTTPVRKTWFGPCEVGSLRDRLRIWLAELGLLGKLAPDKFMPDRVSRWDNATVAALLAFLFEGDGWVTETNNSDVPVVGLGMTARPVVEAARELLAWRFGVHTVPITEGERDGHHNVFILQISTRESVERFARQVRMPGVKGQKLDALLQRAHPPVRDDAEFLYSYVDKEHLGARPTRDLEVDHHDHMFVLANGVIVSNSKQLTQASHRLVVTATDGDQHDPEHPRGLVVPTHDPDNEGAWLAHAVGGYPRNTELTPKMLKDLENRGHTHILVRSPTVGGPQDGGVYARDAGRRERGGIPPIGDFIGLAAAHAIGEPVSQSQLSSKHSGGVAGATAGAVSGFKAINNMIQAPKIFPGGAAHAQRDGFVQSIEQAPQGGHYVTIDSQKHYVGHEYPVTVKKGDKVEAGDTISEGCPNPAEIVKHKGIGEGRAYFVRGFRKVLNDSGVTAHRRNLELLSRGLINHVRLTDEVGDWSPDDVVPYQSLEHSWTPRPGSISMSPQAAVGRYLEKPVLHHSIGTKIRESMLPDLKQFGIAGVTVHHEPPPFAPEMIRGMANSAHDPDWMTRMLGGYQQKSLTEGARRGAVSDEEGTSYVPALARGLDFGRIGATQQPQATSVIPDHAPGYGKELRTIEF